MSTPAWARNEKPDPLEATSEKLRQEVAAGRLHLAGVGHLPLDPDTARRELSEEQRALRSTRPRNRRWRELDKLDRDVDRLTQRQADATARLREAEQALERAPDDDARMLAAWVAGGERGDRPAATIYERQRDVDAQRLLSEAIALELDNALDRRVEYVTRKRAKMAADARKDVVVARERLLAKVRELPELRDALLAARETLLWVSSFPDPAGSYGFPNAVALGLREPVERTLHTSALVEYRALLAALEADATALAEAHSPEQKKALGITAPRTPLDTALWDSEPDMVEWKRQELERAHKLAEWGNLERLATEARDYRPDP